MSAVQGCGSNQPAWDIASAGASCAAGGAPAPGGDEGGSVADIAQNFRQLDRFNGDAMMKAKIEVLDEAIAFMTRMARGG